MVCNRTPTKEIMDQDLKIRIGNIAVNAEVARKELHTLYLKGADLDEMHDISDKFHNIGFELSEIASVLVDRM